MNKIKNIKISQLGRSMVEMLGVLAIVGVLSAGGLAGYSNAMKKHKLNKITDQIQMIITNIETMFANEKDYSALGTDPAEGTANAIRLNLVPNEMIQPDGETLKNPYKGTVQIYSVTYNGVENGAYKIDYAGLPREAIMYYATSDSNVENNIMMSVDINDTYSN
ncbi:MAG TPA: hypothetical protein DIC64_01130 [Alphaproteobacteria bacterium]|nr:hypothetical protein [Alphaproteobacteria bacterium]